MEFTKTVAISLLTGSLAVGAGAAGTYAVMQPERQDVIVDATININEKELAQNISDNMIKHQKDDQAYQVAMAKRKGCYLNRDNAFYLKQHCEGVSF